MKPLHARFASRGRKAATGALAALALAIIASYAYADEPPPFRTGLWEFQRTVGAQKLDPLRKCADPTQDMKKQNAMLEKAGCTSSPVTKSGNAYTSRSECAVKAGAATMVSTTTSVMTVESDSAYKVAVDGTTNGQPTKELLVARRTGDCAK